MARMFFIRVISAIRGLSQLPQRRGKISSADEIFKIGDDVSRDVMAIGREGEEYFVFRGV